MPQKNGPDITLQLGAALTLQYALMKIDASGQAIVTTGADGADDPVAIAMETGADLDKVLCRLITGGNTFKAVASKAIAAGDDVYTAAAGKCTDATTSGTKVGKALTASAADGDIIEVIPARVSSEVGTVSIDGDTMTGPLIIDDSDAAALAVGDNGATNPAFVVDSATASSATGVKVKSAAAAGGVAVSVVSSGANEALTIDAKGAGGITLNGTGTGTITMGANVTMADAKNLVLNTSTGTKIGTAVTQKLGFFNATPVVQPASADQADPGAMTTVGSNTGTSGAGLSLIGDTTAVNQATNLMNDLVALQEDIAALDTLVTAHRSALVALGLIKGAA